VPTDDPRCDLVPEGDDPPPPARPGYENVEEYADAVDRDRPDGHLEDRVEERVDERRQTLQGDDGP
jgi:hypothetical protein